MKKFTLLYVEDDKHAQEWMKLILEDDLKEFFQAFDGQEGLLMYKKHKPDIVLADINMPVMDGLSMAREIKEIDKHQPILIMSAFDDRDTLLESIDIGIDSFVPKPVNTTQLMQKLQKVVEDIEERLSHKETQQQEMAQLHNLAHYDVLTSIPNRFLFNVRLEKAIRKAKRKHESFVLLFIDLDNFKTINDTYGHGCGDKVLQSVSKNIKKIIRSEDTFARIGGDEFSLIIYGISDKEYIDALASKILKAASKDVEFEGNTVSLTCSIGISRFPDDGDTKQELLHLADTAMYKAKKLGKSTYFYITKGEEDE